MNKEFATIVRSTLAAALLASAGSAWAADGDAYDFGGMYGLYPAGGTVQYYANPATGAASCPTGYDAHLVYGTANVDWSMYLCTRPHLAGRAPLYDFGGMIGLANSADNGALPWRGYHYFVNPFTRTHECPDGYQRRQALGTPNVDHNLFYCYRPHVEGGLRMDFAGMTGDGAAPYANPATGVAHTCPSGYSRYTALGSPNIDYTFYYCGKPQNASLQPAGKGSLGLGEPIVPNAVSRYPHDPAQQQADVDRQVLLAKGLRPRVFRMWMLNTHILTDENTLGPYAHLHQRAVQALADANITLVGVDNSFPAWLTGVPERSGGAWILPCPESGSATYASFLQRYEKSWTTIARTYPQIKLWQVANETNGVNVFAAPLAGQPGACANGRVQFNDQDRVDITMDLMLHARRGIKAGNPQALAFFPPPSPLGDVSLAPIANFIGAVYANIAAGNRPSTSARDYFDGVSWHPYIFGDATAASWLQTNNAIHDVLENYGDGDVPVILSEAGNSSVSCSAGSCQERSATQLRDWMQHTLELSQSPEASAMPWLTYLIWFRMSDVHSDLITAPDPEHHYGILKGDNNTPSPSSNLFCQYTGCYSLESIPF
ncbi:hypothetical protein K4L06_01435 [Lysobacter sp. BMK333-48F3]|uniref:hypothetical protein n=1 Tax=Lysobacter sp. BMK333-48F3 TaxID=2867962 RepID=UPI001C8C3BBC|nr:hypothetical protein [Lysobacter sp. BMK333-48F3]MBX9399957.1 hypothetical protein [Lysobacter sp. BMK333-48F3]